MAVSVHLLNSHRKPLIMNCEMAGIPLFSWWGCPPAWLYSLSASLSVCRFNRLTTLPLRWYRWWLLWKHHQLCFRHRVSLTRACQEAARLVSLHKSNGGIKTYYGYEFVSVYQTVHIPSVYYCIRSYFELESLDDFKKLYLRISVQPPPPKKKQIHCHFKSLPIFATTLQITRFYPFASQKFTVI